MTEKFSDVNSCTPVIFMKTNPINSHVAKVINLVVYISDIRARSHNIRQFAHNVEFSWVTSEAFWKANRNI